MDNPLTSLIFIVLTLLALAACVVAWRRLRAPDGPATAGSAQHWLVGLVCGGSAAVFLVRWFALHGQWKPVAAHVDGLALIAALFAGAILYLQSRPRLFGLSAFALPVLVVILAWGICAAAWTYQPFDLDTLDPVWRTLHLVGVYLGTVSAAVAAIAGGMFLYVQGRLKHKQGLRNFGRLASLEALETLIVRTATLGFVLLSLGLAAGVVVLSEREAPIAGGWLYALKIGLAITAWGAYALVMNVRYASQFRGARAAWLAIAGLVLLLATYGLVTALPHDNSAAPEATRAREVSLPGQLHAASHAEASPSPSPLMPQNAGLRKEVA